MEGQARSPLAPVAEGRPNRRLFPRYTVDCPATIAMLSGAGTIHGRMVDLSQGGCRMVTAEPVSLGILARVEVCFELRGCAFRIVGVTAGTRAKRSFGLRFLEMPLRRAEALTELLEEIAVDPAGPQPIDRPTLQPPMELAAGKQKAAATPSESLPAAPSASSAEPASLSPAPTKPSLSPTGASSDRRLHARHGVDTRVNLTLIRGAITMPGCILNLSQGGCRLRTDEHFNVGIYTRVEAEFYLHGLPFRLAGVSQAILDKNTIGIRFLDMSERKRAQLTELIAEIEEMRAAQQPAES